MGEILARPLRIPTVVSNVLPTTTTEEHAMTIKTAAPAAAKTRRGTSNSNSRGSSTDRRKRREYLLNTFGDGTSAPCFFCDMPLFDRGANWKKCDDHITVDRIIPGAHGGKYTRDNIRPACAAHNSEDGGHISHGARLTVAA